jgi:hypothetical protein
VQGDSIAAAQRQKRFADAVKDERGQRFTDAQLQAIERRMSGRFRRDGYPFVTVKGSATVDTRSARRWWSCASSATARLERATSWSRGTQRIKEGTVSPTPLP